MDEETVGRGPMDYENGPQVPDPAVPQDAPQLDVVHDLQQLQKRKAA